jgi:glutathione peroxidase
LDFQKLRSSGTVNLCKLSAGKPLLIVNTAVRGRDANPVFRELGRQTDAPSWNFNKYLVNPDGKVVARYGSDVTPESRTLNRAIESLLQAAAAATAKP